VYSQTLLFLFFVVLVVSQDCLYVRGGPRLVDGLLLLLLLPVLLRVFLNL